MSFDCTITMFSFYVKIPIEFLKFLLMGQYKFYMQNVEIANTAGSQLVSLAGPLCLMNGQDWWHDAFPVSIRVKVGPIHEVN